MNQPTPINRFKQALQQRQLQIGLWSGLADPIATDIVGGAGFDWVVIDGEHAPHHLRSMLSQLQVLAAYPSVTPVVRVPYGHGGAGAAMLKQVLDLGATTVLVPMVDTPEQAADVVRAVRYPAPLGMAGGGIRGMAGARAARWGRYDHYATSANAQIGVLIQAETQTALHNLAALCATEGVDGVFIGPADLSASMGFAGQPSHPQVLAAISAAIAQIKSSGKAAGILATDPTLAQRWIDEGATFVAVGVDTMMLARATSALAAQFKPQA
jgi:4-hydroxy-2-oxoheptanedioate aldolase